jgi:phage/plasmid primase-like uncharacterized protein
MTHYPQSKKHFDFIPAADLRRMARGRWREILVAAGVPAHALDGRRGRPCPKCGGRDRFAPMKDLDDRGAVLCRHCHHASTDPKCGDGIASLRWWLGGGAGEALRWLASFLGVTHGHHSPIVRPAHTKVITKDDRGLSHRFGMAADVMRRNLRPEAMEHCARLLGLPAAALARLGVGWSPSHQATTWPMRDADGNVIGIRLRCPTSARKWALNGSKAGLIFDPDSMAEPIDRLWCVEGPTDAAALLSIELDVAGVPSAGGAADLLVALARRVRPSDVVIVADRDDAGQRGAERLRDALLIVAPVRMVTPPIGIKDPRAWVCSGADRASIERVADAAPVHRVELQGGAS